MTFDFLDNPKTGSMFLVVGSSQDVVVGVRPLLHIDEERVAVALGFRIRMEFRQPSADFDMKGWVQSKFPNFVVTGGDEAHASTASYVSVPPDLAVGPYSTLGFWMLNKLTRHVWLSIAERTGIPAQIPYTDFKAWFEGDLTDQLIKYADVPKPVDNVFAVTHTPTNP